MRALILASLLFAIAAPAVAEDLTLEQQAALCETHRPKCVGPRSACMNNPEFDFADPDLVATCHKRVNDLGAKKEAARKAEAESADGLKLKKEPTK